MILRSVIRLRKNPAFKTPIYRAGNDGRCSAAWQGLLMALTGLAERLTTDPRNFSPPSEFEDGEPGRRRPTRILILDEGVADTW